MNRIDKAILDIDKNICKNIDTFYDSKRGLLSQNILSHLRNFIDHIFLKIRNQKEEKSLTNEYANLKEAEKYVKSIGKFKFLNKFHDLLQISASHYTLDENASERLMLKYYEYLLKIKLYLMQEHSLEVLSNIDKFPINLDKTTQEYYEKISEQIDNTFIKKTEKDRYYIQKIKPFFVNNQVYYEVTFTKSHDNVTKFDRIIAFTKLDITHHYAVELFIGKTYIELLDEQMPINIIENWEVSIRPCELNNFATIFSKDINIQSSNQEYKKLMKFLTQNKFSFNEYVIIEQDYYDFIKNQITKGTQIQFFNILDKCRELLLNNSAGSNIIKYLLYTMNNKIIKTQTNKEANPRLSNLQLKWECIPFDQMPFSASLKNHNPRIYDLFECISKEDREHEFLARLIKNNTEIKGEIFTPLSKIEKIMDVNSLIKKYNDLIYKNHSNRLIKEYKDSYFYIDGYKEDTIKNNKRIKRIIKRGYRKLYKFCRKLAQKY